jgi:hypothetical protein
MSRILLTLCLTLWGSISLAYEESLANCLGGYVYSSRGYLYIHSNLVLKNLDSKSQTYVLPLRESCQRLGLIDGQVQIIDDRRVKFLKLSGVLGDGIIMQSLKPVIQLAIHAQISRSFDQSARHALEVKKFPSLTFTYQANFQKNLYIEAISYGQKWESEGD